MIYIWERPAQRSLNKIVRACAMPGRLTSERVKVMLVMMTLAHACIHDTAAACRARFLSLAESALIRRFGRFKTDCGIRVPRRMSITTDSR